MRKSTKLLVALVIFGVCVFSVYTVISSEAHDRKNDPIYAAGLDMRGKLSDFEHTGDPAELKALLRLDDEGASMQRYICLRKWSLRNQGAFVRLMESMNPDERQQVIHMLVFSLLDGGVESDFRKAFGRNQAPVVKEILKQMADMESGRSSKQ